MPFRFEAWTLPSTGAFTKRFDIPDVLPGASGTVELSTYSDASFAVPATFSKLDQLVSATTGSLIKVFKGSDLIDEFEAARMSEPAGRPQIRQISGPQRNGLLEGIGIAPKDYPDHKAGAMHWKWGAENILPDLSLADLGSIKEEWEIVLFGERYQLDLSSATAGTFTLNPDAIGDTSAIDWDTEASGIRSALQALAGIDDVTVEETDEDSGAFWIVFEDPKDLTTNMTLDQTGLTGSATLTKFNDGFNTGTATFTITVDGQTTEAIPADASANRVEGSATNNTGLQGLSNVNDVTVSGSGTFGDPWVVTFHDPPDPTAFSVTFAAGNHTIDKIVEGSLDPSPITKSKPVDGGSGPEEDHGDYGDPEIEVVTSPLDTGATWALQVNAEARYAGSQIVLTVTPGETYSNISVSVYPELAGTYVLLVKDVFENRLAQTTPRNVPLSAGSYQTLTIPTFTVPDGVEQVVMRVAVTSPSPSTWGVHYVSWQTATFLEGEPEAPWTQITRELLEAAQARGVGDWVELDATDTADTLGTVLPDLSYTAFVGDNSNLVNAHLDEGTRLGYKWQLVPKADAQVISPAGTTTHVLQIFYVQSDEIEDLTATAGGPSVLGGSHVFDAQLVTRRHPYTALIGLGTGSVSAEDTNAGAASIGRIERIVDVDNLGSVAAIQAHLDTQFAEQAYNQKALAATVLESATQLPGVDYGAGSKIWWQFPGIHAKEARPVKRWSWVHGTQAQFQLQGSRVLNGPSAQASAIDMFLRKPGRRRDEKKAPSPTSLIGAGGHVGAHIHLARNSTQSIAVGGEAISWTAYGLIARANFADQGLPSAVVTIQEEGYYNVRVALKWDIFTGGGTVWVTRTRSSTETVVYPDINDPGIWSASDGSKFIETAHAIPCLSGDEFRVYVDHDDTSAKDLASATLDVYLVDVTAHTKTAVQVDFVYSEDPVNDTTHAVSMTSAQLEGDLLLMFLVTDRESWDNTTYPSGWTALIDNYVYGTTQGRLSLLYKVADGTESDVSVNTTANTKTCHVVWVVQSDVDYSTNSPTAATPVKVADTSIINPPAVTPAQGTGNYLVFPLIAHTGGQKSVESDPSGYKLLIYDGVDDPSAPALGIWQATVAITTSEDPGAITLSHWIGQRIGATTVAVKI